MTAHRPPARVPSISFRPFDLLLLGGVAVMVAGVALGSPRLRTAAALARRTMERETVAALTVGIVGLVLLVASIALVVTAFVAARRGRGAR